ncbi:DUF4387 domain-containing protein [Hippea maritima]|uniref:DUF4387 domain-containing protein n=1 Tax=Hippea maritima (strain ATCC 700847 / DSM 10411 / MH2) TaxID=760142 RepID=F2LWA2_HIPMA|nr:DUF4387 domain-containing protein [Hippea maritima]AEA34036.1 hypothetical protein Hipma_1070 [Hippea maritima DSM 10411]
MRLKEAVKVLRSKNAGVWHITIDIVFKSEELYERAKLRLNRDFFKKLYKREDLMYFECDGINTLKVSFLRDASAGSLSDTDCLGANFYIPLLDVEI